MYITDSRKFIERVEAQIKIGDLNGALSAIQKVVDLTFCKPLSTANIFGSKILDNYCQMIGKINYELIDKDIIDHTSERNIETVHTVVLASKLQASGGHSAVLVDMIRLSPRASTLILITGVCGNSDRKAVENMFSDNCDVRIEYAPPGNHLSKLGWIQSQLVSTSPKSVWMFNHHQDSVAVSAVQKNMGYKLKFCHHGDHHLCLGVYLDYADHIDFHPVGFYNCRYKLGISSNKYLPLVARDLGRRLPNTMGAESGGIVTCTAACSNKLEIPYLVKYVDVVPELLLRTGGTHIHIGKLSMYARWCIRRGLRALKVNNSSFVYIPYVPSVWRALIEFGVDIYISSFPHGGGRTLVEVMGAGIPVAVHSHAVNRMLGAHDIAYDGAFVWRDPEELFCYIKNISSTTLISHGNKAREWYEKNHCEEIVREALKKLSSNLVAPELKEWQEPDHLYQAFQYFTETSFRSVILRILIRYYRFLKAEIGRML